MGSYDVTVDKGKATLTKKPANGKKAKPAKAEADTQAAQHSNEPKTEAKT